jgi:hypothetical protein
MRTSQKSARRKSCYNRKKGVKWLSKLIGQREERKEE